MGNSILRICSAVDIATDWGGEMDGPGIESRCGEIFHAVHTGSEAHPASCTIGKGAKVAEAWC